MRRLLAAVLIPALALAALAADLVGKPAPEPEISEWVVKPEGETLEALRGHVVLLLLNGAGETRVAAWNDLRAAYLEDDLRVVAVVADEAPEAAEYSVAKGSAPAYGEGPLAVLVAADGEVAWAGPPAELPEDELPSLLRKASPPLPDEGDPAAKELVFCWMFWSGRAQMRLDPVEAVFWLEKVTRHYPDASGAPASKAKLESIKADGHYRDQLRAADNYVRLRKEWLKAGTDERKLERWLKKAERIVDRYPGTVGAARVARLIEAGRVDPAIAAIRQFIAGEKIDTGKSGWKKSLPEPPAVAFTAGRSYFWVLDTNRGRMKIRFFPDVAPKHVSSTIYLTELGFYDGLTFHRVIPGFMAQGGCPDGTGGGGPGYKYSGEFDPKVKHDRRGILSMAHAGPGTDGSQFFLTFGPTAHLDGKHTVFGVLVEGEETLKAIEALGSKSGATKEPVVIEKATIAVE
jgi:cyclophilin family peptidyl-prolyl cis-trans isomerase